MGLPGLFTVAFVPLGSAGRAELRLWAPLDLAVKGLEVRLQALLIDPGAVIESRFSNLLVERGLWPPPVSATEALSFPFLRRRRGEKVGE